MLAFLADLRTKVTIGFVGGSDLKKQQEQLGEDQSGPPVSGPKGRRGGVGAAARLRCATQSRNSTTGCFVALGTIVWALCGVCAARLKFYAKLFNASRR